MSEGLEEVIAAACDEHDLVVWNRFQERSESLLADAVREWLLADPQIERGAGELDKGWRWTQTASADLVRAALSVILESPNRGDTQ